MKIPKIEYEIFYPLNDTDLMKLNLTICQNIRIDISIPVDINEKQEKESEFMITAYDLYRYLDSALDFYMDSIAIKEDPTELERKQYELIKFWRPSRPDVDVKNILKSLVLSNKETDESEKAD